MKVLRQSSPGPDSREASVTTLRQEALDDLEPIRILTPPGTLGRRGVPEVSLAMVRDFLKRIPVARRAVKAARLARRRIVLHREGEALLQEASRTIHGRRVDVDDPTFFTERVMAWLIQLHRRRVNRFGPLVDKLAVRDYVEERLGPGFLTEILWHGDDLAAVPFDELPERFVIKPTHASGKVVLGGPGFDRAAALAEMSWWLEESYYWGGQEYQYLDLPPRVMIEEYIDDGTGGGPLDYSFWCFGGTPEFAQVRKYPRLINQFYDFDWNRLPFKSQPDIPDGEVDPPPLLEEMREVAARLAEGLEFVRVDLYAPPGRILFGELTLSPSAGRMRFAPAEWDAKLGEMWGRALARQGGPRSPHRV
jgi:hypothetical protein